MNILIAGGGYAGLAAALRLARRNSGAARIVLVNGSDMFVERIRMHQVAAGQSPVRRFLPPLLKRAGIDLVVGQVEAIDAESRTLTVGGDRLDWDRLVLALGSRARAPEGPDTHTLDPGEAETLSVRLEHLARTRGARVAVIGGGLTGIEAATEIAETWPQLTVRLISRRPVGEGWSGPARDYLLASLRRMGVTLEEGRSATASAAPSADLSIWTAGFAVPSLPREAGLAVSRSGQVLVDPFLRALSHPGIYAAGDICAPVVDPGDPMPLGCKSALPAGAHVGDNLARELAAGDGEQPALTPFDFGLAFYCVSLGRRDGLVQWAARGAPGTPATPTGKILTGRRAAWFKEAVCRYTWSALAMEARGISFIASARTGYAPRTLPEGLVKELDDERAA